MKTFAILTAALGFVVPGWTGTATAAPAGGSNAADVISQLQAEGYSVQINGDRNAPLSTCLVTDISGLSGTTPEGQAIMPVGATVYVSVACTDNHDE
jgi:hypothetical protein